MKDMVNNLISKTHIFILFYGLYGAYVVWDEHQMQMEQILARGPEIEKDIAQANKKVKEIQEFSKKTDEYKVRVEEVAKNIESVQKQLPADTNDTQILTFFQGEINALNILDANFVPGKEDAATYFISKEYKFSAKGTFLQFLIFLERIGNADRIYNIKQLSLSNPELNQKGRFQLIQAEVILQAFRFNPDFKVDRGF